MIIVSRDQLHDEVWTEPMTKVAKRYDISDVALKAVCDKHRIPTPPRGYWAKLAAGKKVRKTHYTSISDVTLNNVIISGGINKMPKPVAEKVQAVKAPKAPKEAPPLPAPAPVEGPLHKLAIELKARLEKERVGADGLQYARYKSGIRVAVSPENAERMVGLVHRFCTQAEVEGLALVKSDEGTALSIENQVLLLEFHEKLDRKPRIMTAQEAQKLAAWEKQAKAKSWNWRDGEFNPGTWDRPNIPDFDHVPNGHLNFQFTETNYNGLRRTFSDMRGQRLEDMLDKILLAGRKIAAARIARAEEQERQRLAMEEAARIRKEQGKLASLERKRIKDLDERFELWERANKLRAFVEQAKSMVDQVEDRAKVAEWIEWAEDHLKRLDPFEKGLPKLLQLDDFNEWDLTSRY